jgi:hypothetical protein
MNDVWATELVQNHSPEDQPMKLIILFLICLSFVGIEAAAQPGQAPMFGLAEFDINNAINSNSLPVSSFAPGPYSTMIASSGTIDMSWAGQPNSNVMVLFGPQNTQIATYGTTGQLDIGDLPLNFGIPSNLFVLGDGANTSSFLNAFFVCNAAGVGGFSAIIPPVFPAGFLTRFQCVMSKNGVLFLSNAVDVTLI